MRAFLVRLSFGTRITQPMTCAVALVACLGLWAPAPASAQVTPARRFGIEGLVFTGPQHSAVQAASVTLEDIRGATRRTQTTDSHGRFGFYNIQRGNYTVRVQHANFVEHTATVEMMDENEMLRLEIALIPRPAAGDSPPAAGTIPVWALQIPPRAAREFDAAIKAFRAGNYRASIPRLEAAVDLYPRYAAAYTTLGAAHQSLGDTDRALQAYQAALEIDDSQMAACLGLGSIHKARGQVEDAERLLRRAHDMHPGDWRVNFELGELYFQADEIEKAEPLLRRASQLHHDSPRLHLLLINTLALLEKFPDALAAMDDYLKRFPRHSFAEQVRAKRDSLRAHLRATPAGPPR